MGLPLWVYRSPAFFFKTYFLHRLVAYFLGLSCSLQQRCINGMASFDKVWIALYFGFRGSSGRMWCIFGLLTSTWELWCFNEVFVLRVFETARPKLGQQRVFEDVQRTLVQSINNREYVSVFFLHIHVCEFRYKLWQAPSPDTFVQKVKEIKCSLRPPWAYVWSYDIVLICMLWFLEWNRHVRTECHLGAQGEREFTGPIRWVAN